MKRLWFGLAVGLSVASASSAIASEDFDLIDMIPVRIGPLVAFRAGAATLPSIPRENRQIGASYDLSLPGDRSVVSELRMRGRTPDAELRCLGEGDKNKYKFLFCNEKPKKTGGRPSKKFTIGGRELCVEPDQPLPPGRTGDASGWNASVTWSGWGECSLTFARGIVGKRVSMDDAAKLASEAAAWMEPFIVGPTPTSSQLAENHRALAKIRTR